MKQEEIKSLIKAAKTFADSYNDARRAFWTGYMEGLRRRLHGEGYMPDQHELLSRINPREEIDPHRREEARGYRLGLEGVTVEEASKFEPLVLPARVPFVTHTLKFPQTNPPLDDRTKRLLRNKAKKLQPYSRPVILVPDVKGRRDDGTPVPITTLGQWLFGVPGFRGHITVVAKESKIEINLALPEDEEVRRIVFDLFEAAAKKIGLKSVGLKSDRDL